METKENEKEQLPVAPADPESQPLQPASLAVFNENDDDPDVIFAKAVAEIDTQPLVQVKRRRTGAFTLADVLEGMFLMSVLLVGFFGILWQCITFPHTLVIVYVKANPASITATLDLPTRTLAPVTLTRESTALTTGHGHQDAQVATGTLTFYNGMFTAQTVPRGTVFLASNGVKIATSEAVTIPASDPTANPPQLGYATVTANALQAGASGNIAAYEINTTFINGVSVKNTNSFYHGRDARDYQAVAPTDLDRETAQVTQTLFTAFQTAFPVRLGEQAQPTTCHTTTTADHGLGQEAQTVTVRSVKTCSAIAYNSQQLESQATAAFTQTKPGPQYHLVGSVQTTLQSVTPVSVTISGKWAYTFSPDYEQVLAQSIEGDSPAKARKVLLQTGVIAYASIPNALPPSMYINFLVLVE
jgi:hypothetical protein